MQLISTQLQELCNKAIEAALQAGELISSYTNTEVKVNHKESMHSLSSQVVTEVDVKSQDIILNILKPTMEKYDLALLTEESTDDCSRFEKDYFWCIDPMDGTLSFIKNVPGYSVAIALVDKNGMPQIGVVYDPVTGTLYHAIKGQGAFKDKEPWSPELPAPSNERPMTLVMDWNFPEHQLYDKTVEHLKKLGCDLNIITDGGAVMSAMWVLENAPACYFKLPKKTQGGGSLWDFAASTCIVNETNAKLCNMSGGHLDLNRKDSTFLNHQGSLCSSNTDLAKDFMNWYHEIN
ncbi:inositol monophosphatase [Puteibacter caeruleilacunae]|nr:inositol monophosphatase [Puteibacter caeruleilacunae]